MKRKELFNTYAEDYALFRPYYTKEIAQNILEKIGLKYDAKLLEIGCGSGQATIAYQSLGYEITALDIGEDLLNYAKKNINNISLRLISNYVHLKIIKNLQRVST